MTVTEPASVIANYTDGTGFVALSSGTWFDKNQVSYTGVVHESPSTTVRAISSTGVPVPGATVTVGGVTLQPSNSSGYFKVPAWLCGTKLFRVLRGHLLFDQLFSCPAPASVTSLNSVSLLAVTATESLVPSELTVELTSTLAAQTGPTSTRFAIGDAVEVGGTGIGLRARYPDPSSTSWIVMPDGAAGTVVGGPVWSTGYFRWQIRYDSLPTIYTWSAEGEPDTGEIFLRKRSILPSAITLSSSVSPSSGSANSPFTISGTATYNSGGGAVSAGTATISVGGQTWTAAIYNGSYSRQITAPALAGSYQVLVAASDGLGRTGSSSTNFVVTSNGSTSGYVINDFLTCQSADAGYPYNWHNKIDAFGSDDSRFYAWLELGNVSGVHPVEIQLYRPNGSYYGSVYQTAGTSGPSYDWWRIWAYWDIHGYDIPNIPGRWSIKLYIDGGYKRSLSFTMRYELTEHQMAKGVQSASPYDAIQPTNTFNQTDQTAWTWMQMVNVSDAIEIKWQFYEPNGSQHTETSYTTTNPNASGYDYWYYFNAWGGVNIAGTAAANKCGDWRVNVLIKNASGAWTTQYTDYFKIVESPALPPACTVTLAQANPTPGQTITLNVTATDNTYLKEVTVHWSDGSEHTNTWSNVFANSLNQSKNIGLYTDGQTIEYWLVASDTSGNTTEGAHQSVVVHSTVGPPTPEIVVEQPGNTNIADGGSKDFGSVNVGGNSNLVFTIRNIGTADLTGLSITKDGTDQGMFTVTANPTAPVTGPNGSTTFTVQFAPTSGGTKTAAIHIASNDADENPFDITLTGLGAMVAQTAGGLDPTFNPSVTGGNAISATAIQTDGKILIGGEFNNVDGQSRNYIARLNADGSLEDTTTFNPGTGPNSGLFCVGAQDDRKILLGGVFNSVNGQTRNSIARLNADGSVESTGTFNAGSGLYPSFYGLAVQADGKIVIAGASFTSVNGQPRNRIARLNADGSVESTATFKIGTGANGPVFCVAVQSDGKILLGGRFTSVNGQPRTNIARLNADGSVENTATFNPGTGANDDIYCMTTQPDGKILIGGEFTTVNGQSRNRIARLNADGSMESTTPFNSGSGAGGGYVASMVVQTDGKVLLGGAFTNVNGQPHNRIARLNADGSVESTTTFNPGDGANLPINSVAVQADGKILLAGIFTSMNGQTRNLIARLNNDPATQALTVPSNARVQWSRGGASPEAQQVAFELSTNGGNTWTPLGPGARISGGWELTGLNLPGSGQIRARARTTGGNYNGSSGLVEAVATFSGLQVPEIAVEQPAGTDIADGGSKDFGSVNVGTNFSLGFTIKNAGNADLTGLAITKDGTDQAMFTVTANPTAPVTGPNGSTTFTVRFAPTSAGTKTAAIHIANNDPDENPYDINLTGTGVPGSASIVLSDDFNAGTTDPSKWSVTGNSVTVANGIMRVETTVTDAGGTLTSAPLAVGSHGLISISRRVNLHYANSYYAGLMNVQIGTLPIFGIHYENYSYQGPYDIARYGFFLVRNGANSHGPTGQADTSAAIPAVWNTWFNERLIYNPDTGIAEYFINNVSKMSFNVGILPASANPTMTLSFGAWGWWTGHYQWFDDLVVTQNGTVGNFYTLATTANDGTVTTVPAQASYAAGTTVDVTVNPNPGYDYVNTTGDVTTAASHFTVTMDSNKSLTANFAPTLGLTTRFEDNFDDNGIAAAKWMTAGNTVSETGQIMRVETTVTDAGGTLTSAPFAVGSHGLISISRRVNLHYANSYYAGLMNVQIGTLPIFGIHYENYSYQGPYDIARYGFFLVRNGANSHGPTGQADTSAAIPAVWNTWFNERLIYNPDTGIAEYFINNVSKMSFNVGILPASANPTMTLSFGAWGWWTGHYQWFDDLVVTQNAAIGPIAHTTGAAQIQSRSASLNGVVTPNAANTMVTFEYGLTASYGGSAPVSASALGGSSEVAVNTSLNDLTPGATYHYRIQAMNGLGTTTGEDMTFTTIPAAQGWRRQYFGDQGNSGNGADLANPTGDGIVNLMKYALVIDPTLPSGDSIPKPQSYADAQGLHLGLVFKRDEFRNDMSIVVEAADSVVGPWTAIATSVNGSNFTGPGAYRETDQGNGIKSVEIHDTSRMEDSSARFMRIRVER